MSNDNYTQNETHVILLMKNYGFSARGVGRQLGLSYKTINNALNPYFQVLVADKTLKRIHDRVTALLITAGWDGDREALWEEYKTSDRKRAA